MITADEVKGRFSQALNAALVKKYNGRKTAAFLAREFALLPGCRVPVSAETTRKWLKGMAFPDLENLVLLCDWLDLDLSSVFKSDVSDSGVPESERGAFGRRAVDRNCQEAIELLRRLPDARAEPLIKLIRQLSEV